MVVLPGIPIATQPDPNKNPVTTVDNTVWDHVTIFLPPNTTAYFADFTGAGNHFGIDNVELTIVPEPASGTLIAIGAAALVCRGVLRRRSCVN